jgi:hypothetical protein
MTSVDYQYCSALAAPQAAEWEWSIMTLSATFILATDLLHSSENVPSGQRADRCYYYCCTDDSWPSSRHRHPRLKHFWHLIPSARSVSCFRSYLTDPVPYSFSSILAPPGSVSIGQLDSPMNQRLFWASSPCACVTLWGFVLNSGKYSVRQTLYEPQTTSSCNPAWAGHALPSWSWWLPVAVTGPNVMH